MDVIVVMKIRTSAPSIDLMADSLHKTITAKLDEVNLKVANPEYKINAILSFEANEVRPNSSVTRFITFPDVLVDLEKDLNTNKTTP